jgi:hypothetical protein
LKWEIIEEEVEHHFEEEVENNHEEGEEEPCPLLEDASDAARWATEWQIAKVVEDHEEGEVEKKEPIHSLVGRGGGRVFSFGVVPCLLLMTILS